MQTEDKGPGTALILSLVYHGGTILASKRSSYTDLLNSYFDEKLVAERLQKQHKLMCAAIRAGRIEDLRRMTMKETANRQKGLVAQRQVNQSGKENSSESEAREKTVSKGRPSLTSLKDENQVLLEVPQKVRQEPVDLSEALVPEKRSANILLPEQKNIVTVSQTVFEDEIIIEAVEIIEEEIILPSEAVKILNTPVKNEKFADNKLKIEFPDDITFKGGDRKTINILVCRGMREKCVDGAHVMLKVLGSSFRPLIFHSKTDKDGLAVIHVQLPHFRSGRAAILVRAMANGEEVELRKIIQQG